MKKCLLTLLCVLFLFGCRKDMKTASIQSESKLKVTVTTSFIEDMVNILSPETVSVTLIIPAGEDPHTYEAKPEDFEKLNSADLIIYHGLHFEGKMIEMLEAKNAISLSKNFDKSLLLTMDENNETVVDPHFWFDIELYKSACVEVANALKENLREDSELIDKNLEAYKKELDELLIYGKEQMSLIPKENRYLVTPHDAFSYFSRQYDIEVYAPQGVSTDAELSTNDMAETAKFIVGNKIKAIFAESTTDPSRMEKLKESCASKGFEVSVVRGEGKELYSDSLANKNTLGDSYIDMVKHNIDLIVSNLK